ncbi:MAG: transposase [Myxococcales bacterium]|nr:transposase [Myxococcales bacterium]
MAKQLGLPGTAGAPRRAGSNATGHGGRRPGAGRKRTLPGRVRGKHRARPFHDRRQPVHVVLRVTPEVGRLRRRKAYAAVRLAMIAMLLTGRTGFRVVHLSIQRHHIHLLCEADDRTALANGVRALCVSAAKRLNRAVSIAGATPRTGRVFTDRYHATAIATPRQARHALAYVLNNWRRHREDHAAVGQRRALVDRYSSGVAFGGWAERDGVPFAWPRGFEPMPIAAPTTWLMKGGWRRGGAPPSLWERPGPLAA